MLCIYLPLCPMAANKCKPARFELRAHPDQIQAWKKQAEKEGKTLTNYIKSSLAAKAETKK